jgi:hypothetical protein
MTCRIHMVIPCNASILVTLLSCKPTILVILALLRCKHYDFIYAVDEFWTNSLFYKANTSSLAASVASSMLPLDFQILLNNLASHV